jgi:ABC-type transporter Mla MlaB component
MVLRITPGEPSFERVTMRLEGRLDAEWAALLERECLELHRAGCAVTLDMTGVGLVDRAGIESLARLSREGVAIRCRPGLIASVLEGELIPVTEDPDGADGGRS